jgi:hypothetical protein
MSDNGITEKSRPDIEKLANEITTSVHDHNQLFVTMAHINANYGREMLRDAACPASKILDNEAVTAVERCSTTFNGLLAKSSA